MIFLILDCGGVVSLDAVDYVDLKSPNYPNRYPTDKICTVILTVSFEQCKEVLHIYIK